MSDAPIPASEPITPESKPWHIFHHLWTQDAHRAGYDRDSKALWQALEKFIPVPVEAPPEAETPRPDWRERATMRAESLRTAVKMLLDEVDFFRNLSPEARIALAQYIDVVFAPPDLPDLPAMPRRVDAEFAPVAGVHLVAAPLGCQGQRLKMYNYETILENYEEIEAGLDTDGRLKVWVTYNNRDYCNCLEDEAAREFLELLAARGVDYARQVLGERLKL